MADTQNPRVIKLFSQTLAVISSGEINQFLSSFKLEQDRENYIKRISGKTASLFSLSTESGSILSEAPEDSVEILRDYGYNLGIAFQIVDDILDFTGTEEILGKPVGSDLAQGTLTLPAMLLAERYPEDNPIKRFFRDREKDNIEQAIQMIRDSSIVQDSYDIATGYSSRACRHLHRLPDSTSRQSLEELADYVSKRRE